MTALVIRPATHSDLPHLLDLYVHLNADDARCLPENAVAVLDLLLCYKGSVVLVGAIGDALITTCTLVVIPNLTRGGKPYALIENVVSPTPIIGEWGTGERFSTRLSSALGRLGVTRLC